MVLGPQFDRAKAQGPFYHGTDLDSAIDIFTGGGFSLDQQRHGRHGGEGVYLTRNQNRAKEFGPAVMEVWLHPDTSIAPRRLWQRYSDEGFPEEYTKYASDRGYGAHWDPDDKEDLIVYNPSHLHSENYEDMSDANS